MFRAHAPRLRPGRDTRCERHAPETLLDASGLALTPVDGERRVVVVGGGIAGMAAAAVLAEGGAQVTLLERESMLGGRAAGRTVAEARDGVPARTMGRGFHAFFRQYYNLRDLLRRADPDLTALHPVQDVPLAASDGHVIPVAGPTSTSLPPPWNILTSALRDGVLRLGHVAHLDLARSARLFALDFPRSFGEFDGMSAAEVLDRLGLPPAARDLVFEVLARSLFADPRDVAAAEFVSLLHTYAFGSAEGLVFDTAAGDHDRLLWAPLGHYLWTQGVQTHVDSPVAAIESPGGVTGPLHVVVDRDGHREVHEADAVVLATDIRPLQSLVAASAWLGDAVWRRRIATMRTAPRFVVWRLWLDTPVAQPAAPLVATAGMGRLDNLSMVHLLEREAAQWADVTGGSVVELHAYAVPDDVDEQEVRADLRATLHRLHPELADAGVVAEEWLVRRDAVLVTPDPWAERPGVVTPDPRVVLAGDGIRVDLPTSLMERAATTGMLAGSAILLHWGLPGQPVWSVPTAGPLARRTLTAATTRGRARLADWRERLGRQPSRGGQPRRAPGSSGTSTA